MLTPGEQQLCLVLAAKKYYMLEQGIHEHLLGSLAVQDFPLRAASVM